MLDRTIAADAMRIMITMPWGERLGGAESMLWTLLRNLDRSRVEPHVLSLEPGPFEREVAGLGIRTSVVVAGRLRQPRRVAAAVRAVARLFEREQPDLILNWSPKTQLYGGAAARLAGYGDRVVWWQHGIPNDHWLDRLATALPARAVGCSSHASEVAQRGLWPHRPTFVIHPGIEPPDGASPEEVIELRERLGIPRGRVIVGMVGRLQPWKGQDRLLHALGSLRERGHDVHGLMVGGDAYDLSPRYARDLKRMVGDLGLTNAVTLTGHVERVDPYLQLMDVFVNASEAEPFGIVLLEAMALGTPVLAVAGGGPLEIIEPGRTGVLADGADAHALARALGDLVSDPDLRERLAEAGPRAAARFSAGRMAEEMQSRLEGLVANGT
jgi:glycosyltransferase involved in cell wall biosynthesis